MRDATDKIFGRLRSDGDVDILYVTDGVEVTRLDADVYPVGSGVSARYEHAEGIVLSLVDTIELGITIED